MKTMNCPGDLAPRGERGQILVIFALVMTAVIAMVGLVLDGSSAFAQRRVEQNVADLAALAAANAYLNTTGTPADREAAAIAAARAAATRNGYTHGTDGTSLDVSIEFKSSGAEISVGLVDPHPNVFARIVPGQASWDVAVTASAMTGVINTGIGAAPWTMHIDAFDNGVPKYTSANPQDFGTSCGDYPENGLDMSWTDFNGSDNVNSSEIKDILDGSNVVVATFSFEQYLGQHNNGCHTTLWTDTQDEVAGTNVPVPIVGPPVAPATTCEGSAYENGCFKGWAMFHVISATGGTSKVINGYFLENFRTMPLTVGECTATQQAAGTCGQIIGDGLFDNTDVRLTN